MEIDVASAGARLVDVVKQRLAVVAIDAIGPWIAQGAILRNGAVGRINDRVDAGDVLAIAPGHAIEMLVPEACEMVIVDEDDDLLVVDKPSGMHMHPLGPHRAGTLLNALLWHAGARPDQPWAAWRPRPAHRLDRGASGVVVIAKHAEIHDRLRAMFATHDGVSRHYRAWVHGAVRDDAGTIDAPLGRDPENDYRRAVVATGQRAVTRYRVVERRAAVTELELELETGRTHQIRAHVASLGHPIVGDVLYGAPAVAVEDAWIALRAISLALPHPRTQVRCAWRVEPSAAP